MFGRRRAVLLFSSDRGEANIIMFLRLVNKLRWNPNTLYHLYIITNTSTFYLLLLYLFLILQRVIFIYFVLGKQIELWSVLVKSNEVITVYPGVTSIQGSKLFLNRFFFFFFIFFSSIFEYNNNKDIIIPQSVGFVA